jgi:hypothetical protein
VLGSEHAEGVSLRIREDDPSRVVGLTDVGPSSTQCEDPSHLSTLVVRVQIQM